MNNDRPLRFTDSYLTSTISTTSGLGSNYTTNTSGSSMTQTTPSPRHKTSSTSFIEVAEIPEQDTNEQSGNYMDYRLSNQSTNYFNRPYPQANYEDTMEAQRNHGYFGKIFHPFAEIPFVFCYKKLFSILASSNYFPYRPEMHLATERDYKSFPEYDTNAYREQRDAYFNAAGSSYLNYVRNMGTMTPARKPQMGIAASHHRRTLSNVSPNNLNNAYPSHEKDEITSNYQYGRINQLTKRLAATPPINHTNRMRAYENIPFTRSTEQNFIPSTSTEYASVIDRPDSLPFDLTNTKLRSSLRKYSNPSPRFGNGSGFPTMMQKTSPTKTTPSDSLTSDDSSYLSAKDSSISSQSRVRFSPETLLDEPSNTTTATTPLKRLSRAQRHSISDMLAPNTSS